MSWDPQTPRRDLLRNQRHDRPAPPLGEAPPSLFDGPPPVVVQPQAGSIAEAFDMFHRANPWVYAAFVRLARDLAGRGRRRIGMKMLIEVIRWQYHRSTVDQSSEFRINNNYAPHYARLIMEREPDLAGVFELRKLRAA